MNRGFTITASGAAILTSLLAEEQLEITKVMVGRGRLAEDQEPADLTGLIDPVALATSNKPTVSGQQVDMVVEYRNDLNGGLTKAFYLTEFGIWGRKKGDASESTMIYYATLGDYPQWVGPLSGGLEVRRFPVAIGLSASADVRLAYPAGAFVTVNELEIFKAEQRGRIDDFKRDIMMGELTLPLTTAQGDALLTSADAPIQAVYKMGSGGNLIAAVNQQLNTAKLEAMTAAANDAAVKADRAKREAITAAASDAERKVSEAKQEAIAAAANDAATKANEAKQEAIAAAASDAERKVSEAKQEAITAAASDAVEKINTARSDLTAAISTQIAAHNSDTTAHPTHLAVATTI